MIQTLKTEFSGNYNRANMRERLLECSYISMLPFCVLPNATLYLAKSILARPAALQLKLRSLKPGEECNGVTVTDSETANSVLLCSVSTT